MKFSVVDYAEVMKEVRSRSERVILDFSEILDNVPAHKNIKLFFEKCAEEGVDPKLPENRQKFNNNFLSASGNRYLIGKYAEDRSAMLKGSHIASEGRTYHLGVDIFAKDQEEVYLPADGVIVRAEQEPGNHGYGFYIIIEHQRNGGKWYSFLGHLASDLPPVGDVVKKGERIAKLGDFINNENGGWSRHLHYQILEDLPPQGITPIGYSTKSDIPSNKNRFPDPKDVLGISY